MIFISKIRVPKLVISILEFVNFNNNKDTSLKVDDHSSESNRKICLPSSIRSVS